MPRLANLHVDSNNPYYAEQSNGIVTAKDNANVYLFIPASIDTFNLTNDIILPVFSSYVIDGETYKIDPLAGRGIKHLTVSTTNVPSSQAYNFSGMSQLIDLTISTSVCIIVSSAIKLTTVTCTVDDVSFMLNYVGTVGATLDIYGGKTLHTIYTSSMSISDEWNYSTINIHDIQHICGDYLIIGSHNNTATTWNFPELIDIKPTATSTFDNPDYVPNNFGLGYLYYSNIEKLQTLNCPKLTTIISDSLSHNGEPVLNAPLLTTLYFNSLTLGYSNQHNAIIDYTKLVNVHIGKFNVYMNNDVTMNFDSMTKCTALGIYAYEVNSTVKTLAVTANSCQTITGLTLTSNTSHGANLSFTASACTTLNVSSTFVFNGFNNVSITMQALTTAKISYLLNAIANLTQLLLPVLQSNLSINNTGINCNVDLPAITGGLQFINCTGSCTSLSAYQPSSISIAGLLNLKNIILHNLSAPSVSDTSFGSSASNYTGYTNRAAGTNALIVPSNATGFDTGYWLSPLCDANCGGFTLQKTL